MSNRYTPKNQCQNQLSSNEDKEKPKFFGVSDAFKLFLYSGNHFNKQFQYIPPFELYCTRKKKKKSILFHSLILNCIILFWHFKSVVKFSRTAHGKFQLQTANTSENKERVKPAFQHKISGILPHSVNLEIMYF